MPHSEQMADKPVLKSENKNHLSDELLLSPKQQQKHDALALAEIIYGIFKEKESSANIGANAMSRKDEQDA